MVTYNKGTLVCHNLLDENFFKEILSDSKILEEYNLRFYKINDGLEFFAEDLFYIFYKHIVNINNKSNMHSFLLEEILGSIAYKKLTLRTKGSKFETYLVLKYFMDQIFIRLKGTNHIKDITDYYYKLNLHSNELSSIKEELHDLFNISLNKESNTDLTSSINELNILKNLIGDKLKLSNEEDILITAKFKSELIDNLKKLIKEDIKDDLSIDYNEFLENILESTRNSSSTSTEDDQNFSLDDTKVSEDSRDLSPDDDSESENTNENENKQKSNLYDNLADESEEDIKDKLSDFEDELIDKLENLMVDDDISADEFVESLLLQIEQLSVESGDQASNDDDELKIQGNDDDSSRSSDTSDNFSDAESNDYMVNQVSNSEFENPSLDSTDGDPDKKHIVNGYKNSNMPIYEEIIDTIDFVKHNEKKNVSKSKGKFDLAIFKSVISRLELLQAKIIINEKQIARVSKEIKTDNDLDSTLKKLENTLSNVNTLGIAKQSLSALNMDEAIELEKRLRSSDFKRFIDKVGKKKIIASKSKKKKTISKDHLIDKIIASDDMDNIIEDEILQFALDIDEFEWDFYDRLLNKSVLSNQFVSNHGRNKGPIILCYDGSGSMEGVKIEETKAHIIAILDIAKYQKRKVILIQFASKNEDLYSKEVNPSYISTADIYEIYDTFIKGGTDFEKPLRQAMHLLKEENYRDGDILFITDGHCEISDKFIEEFKLAKHIRRFKLYSIIIHGHTYSDYGDLGKVSDEVLEIKKSNLNDWNEKISEKIFSII